MHEEDETLLRVGENLEFELDFNKPGFELELVTEQTHSTVQNGSPLGCLLTERDSTKTDFWSFLHTCVASFKKNRIYRFLCVCKSSLPASIEFLCFPSLRLSLWPEVTINTGQLYTLSQLQGKPHVTLGIRLNETENRIRDS